MKKQTLLKLGGRKHLGEERWKGALTLFDRVHCTCLYKEPSWDIGNENISIYEIPRTWINQKMTGVLIRTKDKKNLSVLSWLAIAVMCITNHSLIKRVQSLDFDKVLCSYGDYDWSDLSCILFGKGINKPIVRAYKESRVGFNYLEYHAFKMASTVVLYDAELKKFLEAKYGKNFFDGKKMILGQDENALPSCILDNIQYRDKLSSKDGKVHLVILTFRVDSAPNRERDEGRYYYVDVIRNLIEQGIVVHLHCAKYNDDNGVNRYQDLMQEYPGMFYMEAPLAMKHSSSQAEWVESCEILSRYDVGLLHNIVDTSKVSEFDKINIPHRFFAYEAAHVVPIIARGENIVLERMFNTEKCGFIYDTFSDLPKVASEQFNYHTPSYEDYLKTIFGLED